MPRRPPYSPSRTSWFRRRRPGRPWTRPRPWPDRRRREGRSMYETQAEVDAFFACLFQFQPIQRLGEGAFGIAILVFDEVEQIYKVFKLPRDRRTNDALLEEGANLRKLS